MYLNCILFFQTLKRFVLISIDLIFYIVIILKLSLLLDGCDPIDLKYNYISPIQASFRLQKNIHDHFDRKKNKKQMKRNDESMPSW